MGPSAELNVTFQQIRPFTLVTPSGLICGGDQEAYLVMSPESNVIYNWTFPAGANILLGQGETAVVVQYDAYAQSGNITVNSVYACGTGATESFC